ncbi:MAG TPA: hypothetical protein VKX40_10345, partial [Aequorivita sp.]|nr:hypothetical protein [Aequorivita sp.]
MHNVIVYLSLFFTVMVMQGQNEAIVAHNDAAPTKYQQGMKNAFQLWQQDKPWEAANMFERIAAAEPDKWLPPYYVAQINVINSFG